AELIAEVELSASPGVELFGGAGVATVTKPGLGLEVGGPAINPVPRRNITEMVSEELAQLPPERTRGARVTISVPLGEEMALKTTNARLGLLGGISILGTTGIVRPYSTAAFKASVKQEIDVAATDGQRELVLTTGGRSEQYAMALHPHLPPNAFVQVGDFIGIALRQCVRRGIARAVIVGMMGKLSKMAAGRMQTHAAGAEVDMEFLAALASDIGAPAQLADAIRAANTARHVLELCRAGGLPHITSAVCARVVQTCTAHAGPGLPVHVYMVDFGGALLGQALPGEDTEEQA
ncbi:MAG TPA: cobalt-precorrin-5B (C(1))-methyltransferase, partial [Polyangiales bacterium]|nr:cobalt-precorrin-5B (C(1))-methyltransferase [Polyangiales bacterium]